MLFMYTLPKKWAHLNENSDFLSKRMNEQSKIDERGIFRNVSIGLYFFLTARNFWDP